MDTFWRAGFQVKIKKTLATTLPPFLSSPLGRPLSPLDSSLPLSFVCLIYAHLLIRSRNQNKHSYLISISCSRSPPRRRRASVTQRTHHHHNEDLLPPVHGTVLEVICKGLGKTSRFAAGTKAGFAVSLINRKLDIGSPFVLHIEAVKDREEPISFGPDAVLVDYGNGWKLQTVTVLDYGARQAELFQRIPKQSSDGSRPAETASKPDISFLYMAKILVAFVMLFVLGAGFTIALENLPKLILFINSFM